MFITESDVNYEASLATALGRLVLNWNGLETNLRDLLIVGCGGNTVAFMLAVELGSTGLANALRTLANDVLANHLKEPVEWTVSSYERLREYRNYYVHGILLAGLYEGKASGFYTPERQKAEH